MWDVLEREGIYTRGCAREVESVDHRADDLRLVRCLRMFVTCA